MEADILSKLSRIKLDASDDLELEFRVRLNYYSFTRIVDLARGEISFETEEYKIKNIYNSDTFIRVYKNKSTLAKTSLFTISKNFMGHVIRMAASIERKGVVSNMITRETDVIIKRAFWKNMFITKAMRGKEMTFEIEVEFQNNEKSLLEAKGLIACILFYSQEGFNMPIEILEENIINEEFLYKYICTAKLDGERLYLVCFDSSLYAFDRNLNIEYIENISVDNFVLDCEFLNKGTKDEEIVILDYCSKSSISFWDRRKKIEEILKYISFIPKISIKSLSPETYPNNLTDGYIFTNPESYNSKIYKLKEIPTIDVKEERGIVEYNAITGEEIRIRTDKRHANPDKLIEIIRNNLRDGVHRAYEKFKGLNMLKYHHEQILSELSKYGLTINLVGQEDEDDFLDYILKELHNKIDEPTKVFILSKSKKLQESYKYFDSVNISKVKDHHSLSVEEIKINKECQLMTGIFKKP